ncbi:chromate transporter [Gonapodya prolifera JEL478]|uniref:Chromate transporter n=1 Tax=Gonapodya prolifera (strain JEL478) TaxID=1344416 RepID=A0A139AEU7_GONPJ|nr:chromate transporter [Gonapodya prolifera JEL478]|eukprot:KXS15346.1 chromate transporter [Gonapodya prolifera JEL478]
MAERVSQIPSVHLSSATVAKLDEAATEKDAKDSIAALPSNGTLESSPDVTHVAIAVSSGPTDESKDEKRHNAPVMGLWPLFKLFIYFGINAWGGPVAQIALIKERLVVQEKWITIPKWNRVYAVYQILPGPEAAELCCYFGMLSRGRIGALLGGLGFVLPGFALMLTFSYLYYLIGFDNKYFNASFQALQPVVAAMILRAVHKIGEHAILHDGKFNNVLFALAVVGALQSALRINFFITLGVFGLFYLFWEKKWKWAAALIAVADIVGYILYVHFTGFPSQTSLGVGIAPQPLTLARLFAVGLLGGLLSFGGAYTTIPFIQQEAVVLGGWLSLTTFLDGIALGNVLPAPTVIFSTFVGFQGGLVAGDGNVGIAFVGAIITTLGMFIPCFSFTIIGHDIFEWLVNQKSVHALFEGVTASVVGIIAVTALEIARTALSAPLTSTHLTTTDAKIAAVNKVGLTAIVYILTLAALYQVKHRQLPIILVVFAAIGGQFLFLLE